ncbi:MAG: hydroxymethylglutaryl-CoA reductase [Thermoanaerobaculia bacterium]|nr:hydroxymethylglutaryl-CoA reductase [Thermoanaerobaculia bacterium]
MDPVEARAASRESLIEEIVGGTRRFHQLPAELSAEEKASIRREALQRLKGIDLGDVGHFSVDAEVASTRHCENFVGVAQIPLGVTGPLKIRGRYVRPDEEVFVPLATTEGALLASINRGCRAISVVGGAEVWVEDVGMTRAPAFRTSGAEQTAEFLGWLRDNEETIRQLAESTSRYLKLLDIRAQAVGTSVYVRFRFASGDAMGMNMATIACDRVVRDLIEPTTGVTCVALSGNYCVDKKPSAVNFLEGRGKRVHAEVVLDESVLKKVLKTDARSLVDVQYRKNLLGSIAAGALGYNAHFANVIAAFFAACGQDLAQVVEAAMGITCIEPRGPEGVYMSVNMPDVPLGAVGGGTALGTQREALDLMGIAVDDAEPGAAAMRLAEILAATVLAGELSLMAAFTSRDLARAHEELGRGKLHDG